MIPVLVKHIVFWDNPLENQMEKVEGCHSGHPQNLHVRCPSQLLGFLLGLLDWLSHGAVPPGAGAAS